MKVIPVFNCPEKWSYAARASFYMEVIRSPLPMMMLPNRHHVAHPSLPCLTAITLPNRYEGEVHPPNRDIFCAMPT